MLRTIENLPVFSVDLIRAAKASRGPLSGLEHPQLVELEQRYRMYFQLKSKHRDLSFAPTGLIDEIWHLHMLHPKAYGVDCQNILGEILDHDPGFGNKDAQDYALLLNKFERTENLWIQEYGTPYVDLDFSNQCGLPEITGVVMCGDKDDEEKEDLPENPEPEDDDLATMPDSVNNRTVIAA